MTMPSQPEPILDLQIATTDENIPSEEQFLKWITLALVAANKAPEVTLRLVGEAEIRALNEQFRNKPKPTNVLSFPSDHPEDLNIPFLGDIVICAPIIEQEAKQQDKLLDAHWAHMVIHGILHLQGFDHIADEDAEKMEALEIDLLAQLGYANPYKT